VRTAGKVFSRLWPILPITGLIALVWFTLQIKLPQPSTAPVDLGKRPTVGIVDAGVVQGTLLRDPKPLFLPTEFNSSRRDVPAPQTGRSFDGFPAILTFAEPALKVNLPPAAAVPETAAQALAGDPPGVPFIGFGRRDLAVPRISPRSAYVEILEAGTGHVVWSRSLEAVGVPGTAWQPMEFMAAVDPAGLVGPLVLTGHSGAAAVDSFFTDYLAETLRVGELLPPGFYRISVGP
jgi:hypothetical protein